MRLRPPVHIDRGHSIFRDEYQRHRGMHVGQLEMVGNRASAHMELINDHCIHLPGLDRCREFGEVHIDQLFKLLHRIEDAGLSL